MKHKTPKRKRKPSQRTLITKELDRIFGTQAKNRDKWTCQKCGKSHLVSKQAQASHVLTKAAFPHLRFDLNNIKCLCWNCHFNWWHKESTETKEWFAEKFPERWEYLELHKNEIVQFKTFELIEMLRELEPNNKYLPV